MTKSSQTDDVVQLGVLFSDHRKTHQIRISGHPSDDAIVALEQEIFAQTGRDVSQTHHIDGEAQFVLSGESPDDPDGYAVEFMHLRARTTFEEMRLLVGPREFSTRILLTGFGGDGAEPFVQWFLEDLLPMGRYALEAYGAAEIARRIGSSQRRRRHRETRTLAEIWIREGGEPYERLLEFVRSRYCWTYDSIDVQLGLSRDEATRLMNACGYRHHVDDRAYYGHHDTDAVN